MILKIVGLTPGWQSSRNGPMRTDAITTQVIAKKEYAAVQLQLYVVFSLNYQRVRLKYAGGVWRHRAGAPQSAPKHHGVRTYQAYTCGFRRADPR